MLQECKRFLDTNIYRSFNILKTDYATYFKHFDKGFKGYTTCISFMKMKCGVIAKQITNKRA